MLYQYARVFCWEHLQATPSPPTWQDSAVHTTYQNLLDAIELFTEEDLHAPHDALDLLVLAEQSVRSRLLADNSADVARIVQHQRGPRAAIHALIAQELDAFLQAIARPPRAPFTPLPYRRVLRRSEVVAHWTQLERAKRTLPVDSLRADTDPQQVQRFFQANAIERVLQLYPASLLGYELASSWFETLFWYDDTYWTDSSYSWYLYAEGNGYPQFAGTLHTALSGSD